MLRVQRQLKMRLTLFSRLLPAFFSLKVKQFTVHKVRHTRPITYLLKDYQNLEIKGSFHDRELQKTKHPDVYLIDS